MGIIVNTIFILKWDPDSLLLGVCYKMVVCYRVQYAVKLWLAVLLQDAWLYL